MTHRIAAVLIFTLLAANVSHAQVDSFGGTPIKPWGIWRPLSPKSPYLESRVQCDFESKENGRVTSTWDYEIRSRYKHTIDFAYRVELASFELQKENQTVTFKVDSFDSGAKYANYTVLFGGCSQHMTVAAGVHFWLRCLVPTGQPCTENGEQVLADSADSVVNAFPGIAAKRSGRASPSDSPAQTTVSGGSWVVCQATIACGGGQRCYFVSKMFHAPEVGQPLSDMPKYSVPFADWLSQRYPNLDHNAAFGPENGGLPDRLVGSLYCEGANTQQLAQKAFNEYIDPTPPPPGYTKNMNKYEPVPWPSGK